MEDRYTENRDLERIADMLTPKFSRENTFTFHSTKRRSKFSIYAYTGIAAMIAVIMVLGLKFVLPVSAKEVISTAMENFTTVKNMKVEFEMRGNPTSDEDVYRPAITAPTVAGTMYINREGDKVYSRIDWYDRERNTLILDYKEYIRIKDGHVITRHPSDFGDEIMKVLNINMLPAEIIKDAYIEDDGDIVKLRKSKDDIITLYAEFSKKHRQLINAKVCALKETGEEVIVLETKSIETDINMPVNIFTP